MYEQSHRDYLRSVICIIVSPVMAVNDNVITPLPTKPSATKNARELVVGERAYTSDDMQMRQRDVAAPRCKIHEGVS